MLLKLAAIAYLMTIATGEIVACTCGSNFHGKNALEVAKLEAQGSATIFEGTPEHTELQWSLLNAKAGDFIPANLAGGVINRDPRVVVTFRVQRAFKGDLGPEVQVSTGLGGGDCGAVFAPGVTYLVYAGGPNLSELSVSRCSPGGWIGNSEVATDLRYLRNERPTSSDLAPYRPWMVRESAEQKQQRERDFEEQKKRYAAVTGSICGTVILTNARGTKAGSVSFLSTKGYSPIEHPTSEVKQDGSFCSDHLGPGKYYLYFTGGSDDGLTSASYYPGVSDRTKATAIEIGAGQTQSGITFKLTPQKTYSVRGFISSNEKSELTKRDVYVLLVNMDGSPRQAWHMVAIDFQGSFPLPKVKYFSLGNVLPGRYIAYASVLGQGWFTRKEEVTVSTHMKLISLELVHRK